DYPRIVACNPEVLYYLGVSYTDGGQVREWRKETIAKAPPGTMLVWDRIYSSANADVDRVISLNDIVAAGWVAIDTDYDPDWMIFVSPKSIRGLGVPPERSGETPRPHD